jgi:hypothetical protein
VEVIEEEEEGRIRVDKDNLDWFGIGSLEGLALEFRTGLGLSDSTFNNSTINRRLCYSQKDRSTERCRKAV